MCEELQHQRLVRIRIEAVSWASTIVKVHPDDPGALLAELIVSGRAHGIILSATRVWTARR